MTYVSRRGTSLFSPFQPRIAAFELNARKSKLPMKGEWFLKLRYVQAALAQAMAAGFKDNVKE